MYNILKAAGLDEPRLSLIKGIVDTCRECRAWQKRGNETMPSLNLATKFNEAGECDLFFYKRHIGFHIIDRCIRFSAGKEVENKEAATLIEAYKTTWFQLFGPFTKLYSDGETGLTSADSVAALKRLGTELMIRAPRQHARTAESRQSMLRHVMHLTEEELKRHNITMTFTELYAEALFVVNAFSNYGGATPMNALTGRQPSMLPDLENADFDKGPEHSDHRREHRIREASIEAITQSTAVAKVNRTLKGKTTIDGARLFKAGDLIDYHRPTTTKDEHGGWNGPTPVIKNMPSDGKLLIRPSGHDIHVQYPDARLTLYLETIFAIEHGMNNEAMPILLAFIERCQAGKPPETFGYATPKNEAQPLRKLTSASTRSPKVFLALQYIIRNIFRIDDVFAVRLGKSVARTRSCSYADRSVLIYYVSETDPKFTYYETEDTAIDISYVTGEPKARMMQCLCRSGGITILDESPEIIKELSTSSSTPTQAQDDDQEQSDTLPQELPDIGGPLPTIHEDEDEHSLDEYILESFYAELMDQEPLDDEETEELLDHYHPVTMMPANTFLIHGVEQDELGDPKDENENVLHGNVHIQEETPPEAHGDVTLEPVLTTWSAAEQEDDEPLEEDEIGKYVELCFTEDMTPVILAEDQTPPTKNEIATMRVYVSANTKRAVVVKEDDLLSKNEILQHSKEVADATSTELKIWIENKCFVKRKIKDSQNVMTSRYVVKWKWVKQPDGSMSRIIRMRLVLRGFMDTEAFSLDTFSGTAKRQSQRILASEAACHINWIIAALDVDKAFLKGFTYKELAEATGEKERIVCFTLPPGSANALRKFPGFEDYDESVHCLQCIKPGTGTKDAPRAFSLKLRKITQSTGLRSTTFDPEYEIKKDLNTAKHVDDVSCAGTEANIDAYVKAVEQTFGKCKLSKHQFTNCGVKYTMTENHDVVMDQDDYIKTLRPITHSELTGAPPDQKATKIIADMFTSLRGALAYTAITQSWIIVYIVSLQRVQEPTNLDARRLNAITRKLQAKPQKLVYPCMTPTGETDIHTDSGYRRMQEAEDATSFKGYGMRGMNLLRAGKHKDERRVHLIDSAAKSHRLTIRSSYGAELLGASHGFDDAYPTIMTLHELTHGVMKAEELKLFREKGGFPMKVNLVIDAESVYKSLSSRDLKVPAEKTLLGHVVWIREMLTLGLIDSIQWCDTRDMTADGHTKGCIDRELLLKLMRGKQSFQFDIKKYTPHRSIQNDYKAKS